MRRGFDPHQTVPRKLVPESIRARASKALRCRPHRSRECLHAEAAQPSANKEQCLQISESKNFTTKDRCRSCAEIQSGSIVQPRDLSIASNPLGPPKCAAPTTTKQGFGFCM